MYFAFALHNDLHVSLSCWDQAFLTFFPLQGLMVSRYPGEEAFPSFTKGWELAYASPNIKHQVVKVLHFAPHPLHWNAVSRERVARRELARIPWYVLQHYRYRSPVAIVMITLAGSGQVWTC